MYTRNGVPRSEDKYDIFLSLLPLLLFFFAQPEEKNIRLARDDDGRNIMYNIKIKLTGRRHHFRLCIIYIYMYYIHDDLFCFWYMYTYSNNNNNKRLYILLCTDHYVVAQTQKIEHSVTF